MATYSIAQAKDQLSKLVDEALAGETVTITRHGNVVAELRPAAAVDAGRWSPVLIDEIAARAKSLPSLGESAADIIRACATSIHDDLCPHLGCRRSPMWRGREA